MSDWVYWLFLVVQGAVCYWAGYRAGRADNDTFVPTQETWLELQKFRWTHPYNGGGDEE